MRGFVRKLGRQLALALLALGLVGSPVVAEAATLYAITFDDELITIDTTTGAGTLVGMLDTPMAAFGLGETGGNLYTFDQIADRIRQLDPADADTLATIDIGIVTVGEGAMDFRSDGVGYLSASAGPVGQLWSFTLAPPGNTPRTGPGGLVPSMDGMAFNAADVLYGLSQITGVLYTINQVNGATTAIGPTGVAGQILAGLAFLDDGSLFAAFQNGNLYSVNPVTGAATLIGATGFDAISGLTALGPQVPEPATLLLLGAGLCYAGRRARARRR